MISSIVTEQALNNMVGLTVTIYWLALYIMIVVALLIHLSASTLQHVGIQMIYLLANVSLHDGGGINNIEQYRKIHRVQSQR